jgi:hypothetical protein
MQVLYNTMITNTYKNNTKMYHKHLQVLYNDQLQMHVLYNSMITDTYKNNTKKVSPTSASV